jgi:23S rRNA-/tRNA-specific pseudouridylate synthase
LKQSNPMDIQNDETRIENDSATPTELSVPLAANAIDENCAEGRREIHDEHCRQPRNRKNRQKKRPRSEWLMNETCTNSNIDESHENGVLITRLDIMNQNKQGNRNTGSIHGDASVSATTTQALKTREAAPFLRIVYPYSHTFTSFCKARWIGRTILDVYSTEFGSYPMSYYKIAIQQGRIRVSDNIVPIDYKLQAKDILLHTVHRHEPGVVVHCNEAPYINIVEETTDLIAIDKPSTMPVHPCGGYHRNSLMNLLHETYQNQKFYTIHRLDRLTSGLIVIAKNAKVAQEWGQAIQLRDQTCQKIYLARVKGQFGRNFFRPINNPCNLPLLQGNDATPNGLPTYGEYDNIHEDKNVSEAQNRRKKYAYGYWMTDAITGDVIHSQYDDPCVPNDHSIDEWMEKVINKNNPIAYKDCNTDVDRRPLVWFNVACPVRIEQPKIGICAAGRFDDIEDTIYIQTAKPAQTRFGIVKYDSVTDSTIIIVQPMTGRTHQIRIHLQHIQHSIANDPNYGGELWYGNPDGQRACADAQQTLDQANGSSTAIALTENDTADAGDYVGCGDTNGLVTSDVPATDKEIQDSLHCNSSSRNEGESLSDWVRRTCVWCNRLYGTNNHSALSNTDLNDVIERRAKLEFLVRSPGLWLHAFQYKVNDRSFRTEIPEWCHV